MKGFFRRLSDVIAWIGFGTLVVMAYEGDGFEEKFIYSAMTWFGIGVINYLLSGSLRLIPWRKLDE
jgi:hypothetical protein